MLYIAPSLVTEGPPNVGLNPAYRIYTADAETGEVLNHENFFLDIEKANQLMRGKPSAQPEWEFLYDARSEYGLPDLSAFSWNQLIGEIEHDQNVAMKFTKYCNLIKEYYQWLFQHHNLITLRHNITHLFC